MVFLFIPSGYIKCYKEPEARTFFERNEIPIPIGRHPLQSNS